MASRMEKYYRDGENTSKRSFKNEDLYRTIYEDETYTNIEGVVTTPRADKIDIQKIRMLINEHENKLKASNQLVKRSPEIEEEQDSSFVEEEKRYDIIDILDRAKDNRGENQVQHRSLKNTEFNILKNIKINKEANNDECQDAEEELKELLNTISSANFSSQLGEDVDLFDDLKAATMVGDSSAIKTVLEKAKKSELNHDTTELDKSFFTSQMNFSDKDFEQLGNLNHSIQKNNKLLKFMLLMLIFTILVIAAIVGYNFMK